MSEQKFTFSKAEKVKKYLEEGYIIIKVEKHLARKTNAFTKWKIPAGLLVYSTFDRNKTHWQEYWLTLPTVIITKIRRSNRGNIDISQIPATNLKISDTELRNLLILLEEA